MLILAEFIEHILKQGFPLIIDSEQQRPADLKPRHVKYKIKKTKIQVLSEK